MLVRLIALDLKLNEFIYSRLVKVLFNYFNSLVLTYVSSNFRIIFYSIDFIL
jgi:hypothetical protein